MQDRCKLLDGRALAASLQAPLAARAHAVAARRGRPVGLGMIVVGDDPASLLYVRNKARAAERVGLHSQVWRLKASASFAEVAAAIAAANDDVGIDAFLLQLPLPGELDALALLERIRPDKDADGLHPYNVGRANLGLPGPRPCTPLGCMRLIAAAGVSLAGRRAVVVGRSAIVGQPMALMLAQADATVTVCHARTRELVREVREAEVLVVAAGHRALVEGHWLRPGACVIDVGINRFVDARGKARVAGDVEPHSAAQVAGALTPVPGGVGPMTLAMLLDNATVAAEERS